jgi:hypothetical protein
MRWVLTFSAFLLMAFNRPVWADDRDNIMAAFGRCGVFADDRTWLNCIYGAVQPMRGKLGLPPAPPSQTNLVPSLALMPQVPPPPPSSRERENEGGVISFLVGGQKILTNVPLTDYSTDHDGLFTITLANEEVWREVPGSPLPHWRGPASHYVASISKGALNSFNLIIDGEGIKYKVQRVR